MILNIFILAKSGVLLSLSLLAILEAIATCLCLRARLSCPHRILPTIFLFLEHVMPKLRQQNCLKGRLYDI